MFETARKYSETMYYNKEALEQEMDHYLVDPLWHEIVQYRSFFRQDFPLQGKKTYLVRNPLVNETMIQVQEAMLHWMSLHQDDADQELDLFWLKEEETLRFSSLYVKMRYDKGMNPQVLLQDVISVFSLEQQCSYELVQYCRDRSHNVILKLFRIAMECDKRCAFLLYYPTLYMHHMLPIANLVSMEALMEHCDQGCKDLDVTLNFLSLLSFLRLKFSDEMVSLHMREASPLTMDVQELSERYPMLQFESVQFYVKHRIPHHYYTLQDYIQACGVCYETARTSMERLVELKWYQKQKIGKKFVYFII